jgi:CelD/BcsL family acetyltransferase involved in cellulose biosynthesis
LAPRVSQTGNRDVVEIANSAVVRRALLKDSIAGRPQAGAASPDSDTLAPLSDITASQWRRLAERAVEPNGYYLPDWELAVNASARGRTGVSALGAWRDAPTAQHGTTSLIGLVPVISLWRACRIPLPALVSADPYGTLCTPLIDRDMANDAVAGLMLEARKAGAHALILRDVPLDGAAMKVFAELLQRDGMRPLVLQSHVRACLDATRDADELLRDALGPKKLKELRRQRHRLAEHGAVHFDVARTPTDVASAVEIFLDLEASGWKAKRGTALMQDEGDAGFVRRAAKALAEIGQC